MKQDAVHRHCSLFPEPSHCFAGTLQSYFPSGRPDAFWQDLVFWTKFQQKDEGGERLGRKGHFPKKAIGGAGSDLYPSPNS